MTLNKWAVSGLSVAVALGLLVSAQTATAGQKTLGADEVKALITDKTVSVTRKKDGKQWRIYFAPDGKAYEAKDKAAGDWNVSNDGKQCSAWIKGLTCASIADLGDGTYARLKDNGKIAVTWTKIANGNDL